MPFLTRMFGVTTSDAEREFGAESDCIEAIVEKVLLLQSKGAVQQRRQPGRVSHVKGTSARAQFEVYDIKAQHGPRLAARLARGIFAAPSVYPARVRFANADSNVNSDFKADVRSLSFSVDLTRDGTALLGANVGRQDFSLQNTTTLPINDTRAFLAMLNWQTASNPAAGLWSLPFKDKLRVLRTLALAQVQAHQKIMPYQLLRYGSNVPFRHGPIDAVKYLVIPHWKNPAHALQRSNTNALQDELLRHLNEDETMSSFDFAVQFLDIETMTYWGKRQNANFWTENASVEWKKAEALYHTVARLTLLPKSQFPQAVADRMFFDVTANTIPDSAPIGSMNRALHKCEVATRNARMRTHYGRRCAITAGAAIQQDS
jgi:hypothetical protein